MGGPLVRAGKAAVTETATGSATEMAATEMAVAETVLFDPIRCVIQGL